MKLQDTVNTIEKSGNVSNEVIFKIKSSRKSFQILSDLYSDKPLAIVRELGCNAMDSHVMAGKSDLPFHIHLPNVLEPWLVIQDYGTGISNENIYNIYTTYFESTKTNTNDQIGCLGLGSKSPFCYSDSFTITSVYEGVERIYNAFINENGTPSIILISTSNADKFNGISIQIPIKPADFNTFAYAVESAFRFTKIKPVVTGGVINWDTDKVIFIGNQWSAYENTRDICAVMGGVSYPIDRSKLGYYRYYASGVVLYFDIGELEVTPSRESLSYTDSTIATLKNRYDKFVEEFKNNSIDQVTKCGTLHEALKSVYMLRDTFVSMFNNSNNKFVWNGIDISDPNSYVRKIAPHTSGYKVRHGRVKNMIPQFNTKWYYADIPKYGLIKFKAMLVATDNNATVFSLDDYNAMISNGFTTDLFIPLSSLNLVSKTKRVAGVRNTIISNDIPIWKMNAMRNGWNKEYLNINTTIPKYYLTKDVGFCVSKMSVHFHDIQSLMKLLTVLGINRYDVALIPKTVVKHMKSKGSASILDVIEHHKDTIKDALDGVCRYIGFQNKIDYINRIVNHTVFKSMKDGNIYKENMTNLYEGLMKYIKPTYMDYFNSVLGIESTGAFKFPDTNKALKTAFDMMDTHRYVVSINDYLEMINVIERNN